MEQRDGGRPSGFAHVIEERARHQEAEAVTVVSLKFLSDPKASTFVESNRSMVLGSDLKTRGGQSACSSRVHRKPPAFASISGALEGPFDGERDDPEVPVLEGGAPKHSTQALAWEGCHIFVGFVFQEQEVAWPRRDR
jgi:hypothetical protein